MKKIILTLALLVSMAWATPARAFGFDWGVTGGLNYTKLGFKGNLKNEFKSENRAGWFIGPKVNVGLIAGFGLDASLQYSQIRLSAIDKEDGVAEESKTQRSIEIPINLKYSVGLGSLANVFIATGPQFGFNVGNHTWKSAGEPIFETENMTTTWNIGVGAKLLGHLEVSAGYNFALGKVGEYILSEAAGEQYVGKVDDYKANTWKVAVAYYF